MAELRITAGLNAEMSAAEIENDLSKEVEPKLQAKAPNVKIVAGLDPNKTASKIQADLNTIVSQTKAPTVKFGIEVGNKTAVQNISAGLKDVQVQAQQTQNAIKDIANVKISNKMINEINKEFQVSGKVTDEYRTKLRSLLTDMQTSWNNLDESAFNNSLKQTIDLITQNQRQVKELSKGSQEYMQSLLRIEELQSAIGAGKRQINSQNGDVNQFYIDPNFKSELESIIGKTGDLNKLLTKLYGRKNWTFDASKGFENLQGYIDAMSSYVDVYNKWNANQFGGNNQANFLFETANKINQLKSALSSKQTQFESWLNLGDVESVNKAMEKTIANIIKLKGYGGDTENFIHWFEPIGEEANVATSSINNLENSVQKVQNTITGANSKGNYFYNNDEILKSIRIFNQEENAIGTLEAKFKELGATVNTVERANGSGFLTGFTVNVKSATGEIEKFKYAWKNLGTEEQPNYKYALDNITAANAGIQKLIESQDKLNNKTKALRVNLMSELQGIKQGWQDVNGSKSVKESSNIENLKKQYINVAQAIRQLKTADASTLPVMQANVDKQIDKLKRMVSEYHNAEKVATQLRAKGFETVKIDTGNNIDKFVNSINNSKVPISAMRTEVDKLKQSFDNLDNIQGQSAKSSALTDILNQLDNAQTKFQALKELFKGFGNANWLSTNAEQIKSIDDMATKIAIYKNNLEVTREEWKKQGIYVGEIAKKAASLGRSLPNIKKPEKFDAWVNEFAELNNQAVKLKTNLDGQVASQTKIYEIQSQIAKLNPQKDSAEIARLNEKLSAEQKTLSNLQMQSNVFSNLITLEEQEKYITEQTATAREKMMSATNGGIKTYTAQVESNIRLLQSLQNSTTFKNNASNPQVTQTKAELTALIGECQRLQTILQSNPTPEGLKLVEAELIKLNSSFISTSTNVKDLQTALADTNGIDKQRQKIELLIARLEAIKKANPKAMKSYGSQIDGMLSELRSGNVDPNRFGQITRQVQVLQKEIQLTDKAGKTLFQNWGEKIKKFTGWMSMTYAFSTLLRYIRSAITELKEIDTILTEISKTSDRTEASLRKLGETSFATASKYGQKASDYLLGVQEMSRAGFGEAESEKMAELSTLAQSAGAMTAELANQYLIATNAGYKFAGNADMLNSVLD